MNATENVELYRPTKCLINSERVISEFFRNSMSKKVFRRRMSESIRQSVQAHILLQKSLDRVIPQNSDGLFISRQPRAGLSPRGAPCQV